MSSQYSPPTPEAYEDKWVTIKKALMILAGAVEDGSLSGGGGIAIPSGQTSMELTYVSGGAADDDLVQTVTYQPSGSVMTVTYYGATNNIQTVTIS